MKFRGAAKSSPATVAIVDGEVRSAVKVGDGEPGNAVFAARMLAWMRFFPSMIWRKLNWRRIVKLHAGGVAAETVEHQVGQHQDRVGGRPGEGHIGRAAQEARPRMGLTGPRRNINQHEDRHDQGQQHGAAAR